MSINTSLINITQLENPQYSFSELATLFNTEVNGYLLTVLIICMFYLCYRSDLKDYLVKFMSWVCKNVDDPKLKQFLVKFPNDVEDSLGFIAFTGIGILIYIYYTFLSIPQIIILSILALILIIHRFIELLVWLSQKIIGYYVGKKLGAVSKQMEDILSNTEEYKPEDSLKEVKEVD